MNKDKKNTQLVTWQDNVTPVNATNLNAIKNRVEQDSVDITTLSEAIVTLDDTKFDKVTLTGNVLKFFASEIEKAKITLPNSGPSSLDGIMEALNTKYDNVEVVGHELKFYVGSILKKTISLPISEGGNVDLSGYQTKQDGALETSNKTIVGSINELNSHFPIVSQDISNRAVKGQHIELGSITTEHLRADTIQSVNGQFTELKAKDAYIENLVAKKAEIEELKATNATINNLKANKADISQLNATNATIGTLSADIANIKNLVGGNISSENIQTGGITGDRLNMDTIFVRDANIIEVNASKIKTGRLDTSNIVIASKDGGMLLAGNTQQFLDKRGRIRIQLGQDTQGDFDFYIMDESGNILFNPRGITGNAIENGLIKDNMISNEAVTGKKIKWDSFVSEFNKESNTHKLKASKVLIDGQSQTMDVAFNQLSSTVDGVRTTTESNTTKLNIQQGKIETLVADTTISKDGQVLKLKDEYNKTVSTVNSMKNTINSHSTTIDQHTGKITATETKTNELARDLNGLTSRVGAAETGISGMNNKFTQFEQDNDSFKLQVKQTTNLYNLIPNGDFSGGKSCWTCDDFWSGVSSEYSLKGRSCAAFRNTQYYNNEKYLSTATTYKIKKNTKYTLNFHYVVESNVDSFEAYVILNNTPDLGYSKAITALTANGGQQSNTGADVPFSFTFDSGDLEYVWIRFDHNGMKSNSDTSRACWVYVTDVALYEGETGPLKYIPHSGQIYDANFKMDKNGFSMNFEDGTSTSLGRDGFMWKNGGTGFKHHALTYVTSFDIPAGNPGKAVITLPVEFTKKQDSLKWTIATRGYYYSTSGDFFVYHLHSSGVRHWEEGGLIKCEAQGFCKIQNASNSSDTQLRSLTAMLIAIA